MGNRTQALGSQGLEVARSSAENVERVVDNPGNSFELSTGFQTSFVVRRTGCESEWMEVARFKGDSRGSPQVFHDERIRVAEVIVKGDVEVPFVQVDPRSL